MAVTYSAPDLLPFVCAVYVCRCGAAAERHGRHVAEPPRGWVAAPGEPDEHLCPHCAQLAATGSPSRVT